jgi:chromosomal replication initiation ATPase DnaA
MTALVEQVDRDALDRMLAHAFRNVDPDALLAIDRDDALVELADHRLLGAEQHRQLARPNVTIGDIIGIVVDQYGVARRDLLGEARTADIARVRQIAMWLARKTTGRSYPFIGRVFGRDHSTVIHAMRTVEMLRDADPGIATSTNKLLELILGGDR